MNKWLFINGSPRKEGNTKIVFDMLKKEMGLAEDEWMDVFVHEKTIFPCDDCRACKSGALICQKKDPMVDIYEKMEKSRGVLFGGPVYWSGVTGPLKILIDHLRTYYKNEKLKGKKAVVVSVGTFGNDESDLIDEMYNRIFAALKIEKLGCVNADGFDKGDVIRDKDLPEKIKKIAVKMK